LLLEILHKEAKVDRAVVNFALLELLDFVMLILVNC